MRRAIRDEGSWLAARPAAVRIRVAVEVNGELLDNGMNVSHGRLGPLLSFFPRTHILTGSA